MADVAFHSSCAEEESLADSTIAQALQQQHDDGLLCRRKLLEPVVLPRFVQIVHAGISEAYPAKIPLCRYRRLVRLSRLQPRLHAWLQACLGVQVRLRLQVSVRLQVLAFWPWQGTA